jgi:hypothetical protein
VKKKACGRIRVWNFDATKMTFVLVVVGFVGFVEKMRRRIGERV